MLPVTSLETRDLRLVQAIAEAGGVTRAGRILHLSQSAVSHQLKDLETRLGLSLFDRRGRGVQMTRAGKRLLDLSREVLEPIARAEHELRSGLGATSRNLRISTECQTAYYWLPQVLGAFSAEHPDVVLRIVPEATEDPLRALADGELDLVFGFIPPKQRQFAFTPLFDDELVAVLPPMHPLARRPFIDGSDLVNETLFLPEVSRAVRDHVRGALFPAGKRFPKVTRVPLTEVIVELVKARQGVSVLANWGVSLAAGRKEVATVRLTRRGLRRKWRATYRRTSEFKDAIKGLVALLKQRGTAVASPLG